MLSAHKTSSWSHFTTPLLVVTLLLIVTSHPRVHYIWVLYQVRRRAWRFGSIVSIFTTTTTSSYVVPPPGVIRTPLPLLLLLLLAVFLV